MSVLKGYIKSAKDESYYEDAIYDAVCEAFNGAFIDNSYSVIVDDGNIEADFTVGGFGRNANDEIDAVVEALKKLLKKDFKSLFVGYTAIKNIASNGYSSFLVGTSKDIFSSGYKVIKL